MLLGFDDLGERGRFFTGRRGKGEVVLEEGEHLAFRFVTGTSEGSRVMVEKLPAIVIEVGEMGDKIGRNGNQLITVESGSSSA